MAAYIGLQEQIRRNNFRSGLILAGFPLILLASVYAFFFFTMKDNAYFRDYNDAFLRSIPIVLAIVGIWFAIAYFSHASMIRMATSAKPLDRKENMRVYNLTENLCMSVGMKMPQLFIIDSPALNAFASGIDEKSYAVTLTSGIIEHLEDDELEGVIAHELTHIRNKDVRLLIVSIIFVGILSFIVQVLFRSILYGRGNRKKDNNNLVLVALVIAAVAYLLSILFKFALSRKREYLADAGAVEMTKNTKAMASALRKISTNSSLESIKSDDVKQLFIEHRSSLDGLFATHPPISKRIAILEQM